MPMGILSDSYRESKLILMPVIGWSFGLCVLQLFLECQSHLEKCFVVLSVCLSFGGFLISLQEWF